MGPGGGARCEHTSSTHLGQRRRRCRPRGGLSPHRVGGRVRVLAASSQGLEGRWRGGGPTPHPFDGVIAPRFNSRPCPGDDCLQFDKLSRADNCAQPT